MPSKTFFNLASEKQEKLLLAAREEFSRVPYSKASINRIIKEANIPRGSFYMYFEDKADLFHHLVFNFLSTFCTFFAQALDACNGDLFEAFEQLYAATTLPHELTDTQQQIQKILAMNRGLEASESIHALQLEPFLEMIIPHIDVTLLRYREREDLIEAIFLLAHSLISALCHPMHPKSENLFLRRLKLLRNGLELSPKS